MININNVSYKICLIDTCVISDLFEDESLYKIFIKKVVQENLFIAVSISTINELKRVQKKYIKFKDDFTLLPTFLIKPSNMLLKDELDSYPNKNDEKIWVELLYNNKEFLDFLDKHEKFQLASKSLDNDKKDVLKSILSLKVNFPPDKSGKYSDGKINKFVEELTFQQLSTFYPEWIKLNHYHVSENNLNVFKSLRSQALIAFWKFYLLKDRKPRESDVFDLTIVSSLPYVDIFITENNMKNDIEQIKKKGLFFEELNTVSIKELKAATNTV